MWELDHKEDRTTKELMLFICGPSLDCKEIKPVHSKGNQPWTDAEAPILWPLDAKNWFMGKDPDAGKWSQKGTTEDEMVGWHHWLNWHEFEEVLGDGEGQGSLVCYSSWGRKELDTTERLNNTQSRHIWDWWGGRQSVVINIFLPSEGRIRSWSPEQVYSPPCWKGALHLHSYSPRNQAH